MNQEERQFEQKNTFEVRIQRRKQQRDRTPLSSSEMKDITMRLLQKAGAEEGEEGGEEDEGEEGGGEEGEEGNEEQRRSAFVEAGQRMGKVLKSESKLGVLKQGFLLGKSLRSDIDEARFDGFLVALLLAIVKDFWLAPLSFSAFFDAGSTNLFFNMFITMALVTIVLFQGLWFRRFLLKHIWKRAVIPILAEMLPFVSIFPWYVISILLIKHDVNKRRKELEEASTVNEKDVLNLSKELRTTAQAA